VSAPIVALADALASAGVRALFGIPGSGPSLQLITRLETLGVPFHGASHEASAAVMAGAFGACSATLGCSVSIRGPGLGNALAGILSNRVEQRPTLSIAESLGASAPPGMVHKRLDHGMATALYVMAHGTL
jgi:acetolactate synthase-1/2/3 large subunit